MFIFLVKYGLRKKMPPCTCAAHAQFALIWNATVIRMIAIALREEKRIWRTEVSRYL